MVIDLEDAHACHTFQQVNWRQHFELTTGATWRVLTPFPRLRQFASLSTKDGTC